MDKKDQDNTNIQNLDFGLIYVVIGLMCLYLALMSFFIIMTE
ncbi:hypothetical protein [Clostridium tyrobutyricum]|jgi:hypothetical protein|nr:hypothetical protein [Clostridium tyrobutyricum]